MIHVVEIPCPNEASTTHLAQNLAGILKGPGYVFLNGPVGAGKSSFCRAFIQAKFGAAIDVPSPTFTLVQTYDLEDEEIWHVDLYRLGDTSELIEFGLDDTEALCLIEWPDLARAMIAEPVLEISIEVQDDQRILSCATSDKSLAQHLSTLEEA